MYNDCVPRPTYNKEFSLPVVSDERGIVKQIVYRLRIENGTRTGICVGYQIRDSLSGRLKDIVRYDDSGGVFHRHSAGLPPGRNHITMNVQPGLEIDAIEADLAANANVYEAEAVRYGYEVAEDADDTDS